MYQSKIVYFQRALSHILPDDAILVGHTLECDFNAMRVTHPYCVDISLCLNLSGKDRQRSSLKVIFCLDFIFRPIFNCYS